MSELAAGPEVDTSPPRAAPGSVAWERGGAPPLSFGEQAILLRRAGAVLFSHLSQQLRWKLGRWRIPAKVDLAQWSPPDSGVAREAEALLREVASPHIVNHSLRTYYFTAIRYELSVLKPPIDREVLYVASLMHDVCLCPKTPPPANEHCFTVACAREARRIATRAGWDEARQDRMALAITSNLNLYVPIEQFGAEAHFLTAGGMVEVLAQEWNVNPENLADVLARFPRAGVAAAMLPHVREEMRRNPRCRFACLNPLFPLMVRLSTFSGESLSAT